MKKYPQTVLEKVYIAILLVIFGGIVLHAPFSVFFGSLWPDVSLLIKSWKEILMAINVCLLLIILIKKQQFKVLKSPAIAMIGVYILLHLVCLMVFNNGLKASVAGLFIDLRYLVYFVLAYSAVRLYPGCRKCFVRVGVIGVLVVLVFAILQVFILPKDILSHIGYRSDTIAPYMTVDDNPAFVRINSTLRGPNPLGAYSLIVLVLSLSYALKNKIRLNRRTRVVLGVLFFGGLIALYFSYSRSALLAAVLASLLVLVVSFYKRISVKKTAFLAMILAVFTFGFLVLSQSGNSFISNVVLHDNPTSGARATSNYGHFSSLIDGFNLLIRQPFGVGVGSTGSASLMSGANSIIIEDQYLFIAHEVGWLGLLLFLAIFGYIVQKMWKNRTDWLSLGVLASGLGLALVGLLLPVWVDDTVSIIWWGLAGIILGGIDGKSEVE